MEHGQQGEWVISTAMGTLFVPRETVELKLREYDLSHDWSKGLINYPNIETKNSSIP